MTLDEVFLAASVRAASLVPETSGYLALAVGDATSRLPFAIDDRMVMLTTEGNVGITKRGEVLPPKQAAAGLRNVLTRLLAVSTGTAMPALAVAGKPKDESDRGVDAVVEEIEAALIPVNRAAARRALARLARETIRAKEAGKVKPRTQRPPANKPAVEPANPPPVEAAKPAPVEAAKPAPVEAAKPAPVEAAKPAPVEIAAPIEAAAPRARTPRPPRVETPRAPVVATRIIERSAEVVVEATTPPPMDLETKTSLSAPIVILPTPPPVPVMLITPPPPAAEPTPTLLGMGAVEIEGHEPETAPMTAIEAAPEARAEADEIDEEENIETVQAPGVAPIEPEARAVLTQPSEAPGLAFELDFRGPRPAIAEPITPPFALDLAGPTAPIVDEDRASRSLAVALPRVAEPRAGRFIAAPDTGSRADDLLARFGASCMDDAHMAEAASCLRKMAGVDMTPPPSRARPDASRVLDASPEPETKLRVARPAARDDFETPAAPSVRRAKGGLSVGLAALVLAVGVAGGGALVRLRPDLFGVATPKGETTKVAPPSRGAATAEPQGAASPAWTPSGGARAERGTAERAR